MYISIDQAIVILNRGGIVAFPTETVYGLGALATNIQAIKKVFAAKHRPVDNPLICHFYDTEQIKKYVSDIPLAAKILFESFSPGPLSILLSLPPNSSLTTATCGQAQVVCRIPNHPIALELLKKIDIPLAAPSANTSGKMSGTTAQMVEEDLGSTIDGIIDGGSCSIGLESTILDGRDEKKIVILRPGSIGSKEIKEVLDAAFITGALPHSVQIEEFGNKIQRSIVIPGTKYKHYSPTTPIFAIKNFEEIIKYGKAAIITVRERFPGLPLNPNQVYREGSIFYICLGSKNNLEEISKNLYRSFYFLDTLGVGQAYFLQEDWGISSLAKALENRLGKVLISF